MTIGNHSPPRAAPPAVAPDQLQQRLGQALAGQYLLERELGRGGMGVVYLARELNLDRLVAIKALPPELATEHEVRERFLREARTAAQLSHPNIVPIHRADEVDGIAYFSMGYVEGETLAERMRTRGIPALPQAVRILREVAWALAYAHARGVVHRDVKPENILVERGSGRAVVTDFGIARDVRAESLTRDGHVLGTVHYMSPEQVRGEPVDGRSDLYALGIVAFLLLTGRLPFEGLAAPAVLVAHATKPAPPVASIAPVPPPLAAIVDRCLAKDPAHRFASGEALAEVLADPGLLADDADTPLPAILSDDQAAALWRRAAELQSEASRRLERRLAEPASGALPSDPVTGEGFRLTHVRQAAVEAGIGPEYVALALSELPQDAAERAPLDLSPQQARIAEGVLGATERTITVSRPIEAPPRDVLSAIGRVFTGHPYDLSPGESIGGHPLDGGIIVFDVPEITAMEDDMSVIYFRYYLRGMKVRQLRVTLRQLAGAPAATEVSIHADLRDEIRSTSRNVVPVSAVTAVAGTAGAFWGGTAMLAIAPVIAAVPALAAGALLGVATVGVYAWAYRHSVRSARTQLRKLLDDTAASARTAALFGDAPTPDSRRRKSGDGWSGWTISDR